jgi:23S rRNA pseudouridine1911/1915/1917 synthase
MRRALRGEGEAAGERLDRFLAARLELPRNQVQRWIDDGRVWIDGAAGKASSRLESGMELEWEEPDAAVDDRLEPEAGELAILHEDDALLAIDKPPGLVVHPGAGRSTGTLVHRLLARFPELAGVGGPGRPGIVHRLDQGTSGVLVVARTAAAYQRLSRAFAAREVEKVYLAVCHGELAAAREVEAAIGRHPTRRTEMTVRVDGRPAHTRVRPLDRVTAASLLEIELLTGRTHQIRVHLRSIGHPLVGDPVYGEARWKGVTGAARALLREFPRPALHAWRVRVPHPRDGHTIEIEAPVPADLRALWRGLSGREIAARPGSPLPAPAARGAPRA